MLLRAIISETFLHGALSVITLATGLCIWSHCQISFSFFFLLFSFYYGLALRPNQSSLGYSSPPLHSKTGAWTIILHFNIRVNFNLGLDMLVFSAWILYIGIHSNNLFAGDLGSCCFGGSHEAQNGPARGFVLIASVEFLLF